MADLIGKFLGKVRIDMFLAQGGMADVYLGTHTTLQRGVAVKLMKNDLEREPELKERFEREARVVAMLRHPNIVQVFDFDTYEGQPYLVMEYVSGSTLGNYLRKLHGNKGRMEHAQIGLLLNKLADALNYAHEKGVIHRDIKPGNILLTSRTTPVSAGNPLPGDTEPIVTDFGLVRFKQSATQTATGLITGTPAYMSPEQARGATVDISTDVYSLGVTVYEMLAGQVPFEADSTVTVLHMHIYEPPPPIEGLSDPLQDVINRVLAKNPDDRYQSALEFANAFQAALYGASESPTLLFSTTQTKARTTQTTAASTTKPMQNNRWYQIGIGAVFVGLIGILILLLVNTNKPLTPITVQNATPTQDSSYIEDNQDHAMPDTNSTPGVNISDAPVIGRFRFQDGTAPADQVTLSTTDMPLPAEGNQYEAWLIEENGEQRRSIGMISFDENNNGLLTFVDNQGRNLLGLYHGVEITIEPNPDPSPNPSNNVAYFVNLPSGGLTHVRHLLYSFGASPNKIALIQGLETDTKQMDLIAQAMLASYQAGNQAEVRLQAEQLLNMIVGSQSEIYKDWNGDGTIDNPSDGYGLLLNGDNAGYIQGVFSHADFAVTSPDATQNMIVHGEHVKICATNISEWTPQLRDALVTILNSSFGPEMEGPIRQAVVLANQIQNGIDVDGNEKIEPIPGEGGALTAYAHTYYMADISIQTDSKPK